MRGAPIALLEVLKCLPKHMLLYGGLIFPFFTTNVDNLRSIGLDGAAERPYCPFRRPLHV